MYATESATAGVRQKTSSLTQACHQLQIETMKLAEVQERYNQRSQQIGTDLSEIAAQEAEQQQALAESEQRFEMLDIELAELQEAHEAGQTTYLEREARLNQARQQLRELELSAQEAAFAEKSHRARMEEIRRNIQTAEEQAEQLFHSVEQGQLELETMTDETAQDGLQDLLDRRTEQEKRWPMHVTNSIRFRFLCAIVKIQKIKLSVTCSLSVTGLWNCS
jgi:chromosome segregation protein